MQVRIRPSVPSRRSLVSSAVLATSFAIAAPAFAEQAIHTIPLLPGGTEITVESISPDGTAVVGHGDTNSGSRAFRWTLGGGNAILGTSPGATASEAHGVGGAGGTVVTGTSGVAPFRWIEGQNMQSLGLPTGAGSARGQGISGDGAVIVGAAIINTGVQAFRWTEANGYQILPPVPGDEGGQATAASYDGSVVGGFSGTNGVGFGPVIWTQGGGVQSLGLMPGASSGSVLAVSDDGTAVAGYFNIDGVTWRGFRWTQGGGMQAFDTLGGNYSFGLDINADGSMVVGRSNLSLGGIGHATLWTEALGLVDLNEYLPTLGFDLTGWHLTSAETISADGSVIAGIGTFNGERRGWVITGIPAPGSAAILALAGIGAARRRRAAC